MELFRRDHVAEGFGEGGQGDGEFDIVQQPADVAQGIGDTLQEVSFALVEAAESVGAKGLHDAHINVGVVVMQEGGAIEREEIGEAVEIGVEELLAERGRKIGLGIVEQGSDVVLEGAAAASLIVDEEGVAVDEHDVAGLEIAVEKIVARSAEEKFGEMREIVFESLLVEGDSGEAEEIIFEIVEVPGDGLAIETRARVGDLVVEIARGFGLKPREDGGHFFVGGDDGRGDFGAVAIL